MSRTLLIDGDWIAFVCASVQDDPADGVIRYVRRLARDLGGTRTIVCLSDPSRQYFRSSIWPAYKAERSEQPITLPRVVETLHLNFECKVLPGMEADDVMGILATGPWVKGERLIVGVDKDLLTIPGMHANPRKAGIVHIDDRAGAWNHLTQTLTGDSGDGFPGCPRIGPKAVGRILCGSPSQWWSQVVCAFKGKGLTENDALRQARLARICRACDYDVDARRVIPWIPDRLIVSAGAPQEVCA